MRPIVITGAPGSGKTTKAREISRGSDIVFDFDAICHALNPQLDYECREVGLVSSICTWRDDLMRRAYKGTLGHRLIMIITDTDKALRAARYLKAELIDCGTCPHPQTTES